MNKNYVPNISQFVESLSTSRFEVLNKMLECKNPAFVLVSILKRADIKLLRESANLVEQYGDIVNNVYDILCETSSIASYRKINGRHKKFANSTGKGSLKKLAGDEDAEDLSDEEWKSIGRKIAKMEGYNKRDYIGMMNFLSTSCFMHEMIKRDLSNDLQNRLAGNYVRKSASSMDDEKDVDISTSTNTRSRRANRSYDRVTYDPYGEESGGYDYNEGIKTKYNKTDMILEAKEKLSVVNNIDNEEDDEKNDEMNYDSLFQMLAYTLSRLKDVDVADISNDIEDYENGEYEPDENDEAFFVPQVDYSDNYGNNIIGSFMDGYVSETKGYDKDQKRNLRYKRWNGRGGLKSLVGKTSGDDLEDDDLKDIASKINKMPKSSRGKYMSYVGFLGSSCEIFMYIKSGFLEVAQERGMDTGFDRKERWE